MADVYQVALQVKFVDGSEVRPRLQTYDSEASAAQAAGELGASFSALLREGQIVTPAVDGKLAPAMSTHAFCAALGIAGLAPVIYKLPVHGAVILAAKPSIILQ